MTGLAYSIMAARKAAVALDKVTLILTRAEATWPLPCRIYKLSGDTSDQHSGGSARLIGSAGISARQEYAVALEEPGDDIQPGDTFTHPHASVTCQVVDVKVITAEGLICAKTAIARQLDE